LAASVPRLETTAEARRPFGSAKPEWTSFVARCLSSWVTARASASEFLATWTPLRMPDPQPRRSPRGDQARRLPSSTRRGGRRATHHHHPAAAVVGGVWRVPIAIAGGADALRTRYPLVSALLVELAARPSSHTASRRTRQRL